MFVKPHMNISNPAAFIKIAGVPSFASSRRHLLGKVTPYKNFKFKEIKQEP
jgi:hypothetical protein